MRWSCNHDVFDKGYTGDRTEDQDSNNPGVNANYAKPSQPRVVLVSPAEADRGLDAQML
jgi:hypothetical protein